MIKILLFSLVFIMSVTTSYAENTSKLTYLDKYIKIMSVAANKNIAILTGEKTVENQSVPVIYISKKISQWKELKLPQDFEVNNYSYGNVIAKKEWFYLAIKKRSSDKRLFLISKDGVNWGRGETFHQSGETWVVIGSYKLNKEKIQILWNGYHYILYNTHHQLPIPVWQSISSVTNLAPVNVEFNSYCVTKGKIYVSSGAVGIRGPTPVAYSNNMYYWKYPTLLRPSFKSGNKIYQISCFKNGEVIGTGNSDGTFFDEPNIRGMIVYSDIDNNGNMSWKRKFVPYPISNATMAHDHLFIIGWDKKTKSYFYGKKPLSKRLGSPKMAVNNRVIIVGNNVIYEDRLEDK